MLKIYATLHTFMTTRLTRDEKGATAVEYGIMVALIAVAIITAVSIFGGELRGLFEGLSGKLTPAA
ncbi:Flp family type IVb pilin [Arthrobacter roseus]|uniref:Flp family type IVb pilin n=1 Tax=Arthrobacter roseus TaxID=136274 RepID=UPI0019659A02|nr:Flp family type IVb pilin [Arthrobacter roseus]MBM7849291.1 pilus assembly protein Flp/PilA [Arthrobacter roseus]